MERKAMIEATEREQVKSIEKVKIQLKRLRREVNRFSVLHRIECAQQHIFTKGASVK